MQLFESHADVHEDVGQVLEGPITVAILKAQREMLKDMFHSENPTKMDRAALLRYIYFTASQYGWEYPDMDKYEQRANIGKACVKSRPIGKGAKPPAGILPKKDRPSRTLTRHQRFMSQEMKRPELRADYPDIKERFAAATASWHEHKDEIARQDRSIANRRRARQQAMEDAQDAREERARTRRQAAAARQKESEAITAQMRAARLEREKRVYSQPKIGKRRNPARAASRR